MKKRHFKCKIECLILFCLWLLFPLSSFAQINVKEKVTDSESIQPLSGVTVIVKGSTIGTITDLNGNYTISVPNANIFSQLIVNKYLKINQ